MGSLDPLIAAEVERANARIADIEIGLTSPGDADYWRQRGRSRIRILEQDRMDYGLMPHEEDELTRLVKLVGRDFTVGDFLAGAVAFSLVVAAMVACAFVQPA